jgi:hypothetical protein
MKSVISLLKNHIREYLSVKLAIAFALVMIALLAFNYTFNFEDGIIDQEPNDFLRWLWMFLFHGLPYLLVCALSFGFTKRKVWMSNPRFWLLFIAGFSVLAFDRSWSLWPLLKDYLAREDSRYIFKVIKQGTGVFTVVLPLLLLYAFTNQSKPRRYYGIAIRKFDARPYFAILGIAAIFIIIAGFFSDIQQYYPRYSRTSGDIFALSHHIPEWIAVLGYELPYGFDFISTEFMFRGFMVIGLGRILGPKAILPMAAAYCVLHFGKPLTEAASSIFGGYILGVIAWHHKNIWGGVIIHVGVAWMMELVGFGWRVF